ncbi:unnamed protein product, partial [Nesidiocoris tenuis]
MDKDEIYDSSKRNVLSRPTDFHALQPDYSASTKLDWPVIWRKSSRAACEWNSLTNLFRPESEGWPTWRGAFGQGTYLLSDTWYLRSRSSSRGLHPRGTVRRV